jgi:hypothetical protein
VATEVQQPDVSPLEGLQQARQVTNVTRRQPPAAQEPVKGSDLGRGGNPEQRHGAGSTAGRRQVHHTSRLAATA